MRFGWIFAAPLALAQVTYEDLKKADPNHWLHYSGQYHAQRHTLLNQIHTGNVKNLVPAWIYHVRGANRLESVPIFVDGVLYVSQTNEVHALDGRTGRPIWDYRRQARQRGPNRGIAVYGNKVYMGTADAYLVALDARTGSLLWE
jgi:glucose dehydrogenase